MECAAQGGYGSGRTERWCEEGCGGVRGSARQASTTAAGEEMRLEVALHPLATAIGATWMQQQASGAGVGVLRSACRDVL